MTTPWKNVLLALPADAATVWIRRTRYWDTPATASFDLATLTFTTDATALVIPAYLVHSWRPQ